MSTQGSVRRPAVVLVGAPGSGKSTIGPLLAETLKLAFRDVDADIEAQTGKAISDIFLDDGEERFRELEHQAVAEALSSHDGVLALGGGAVLDPRTRQALAGHRVVWLVVSLNNATRRVGLGTTRPVLNFNPRATLGFLMEQRHPLYEEVASLRLDTSDRTPEDIATELARILEEDPA